ncbi:MAG: hypothetical protein RBS22_14255 [Spongiibacteraceae bacterium]|jgi:hypothetical protein|nr:hypothetical protein [Spongiibacteraceae bacterium]
MKRLYYLTDSMDIADRVSERLQAAGLADWNFHVLSRDEAGVYRRHLHGATPFHRRDIIRGGERGALIGAALGLLAATFIVNVMQQSTSVETVAFAVIVVVFTLFGAWDGGMVGLALDNHKIARFRDDIYAGRHLLLIDVPRKHAQAVHTLMRQFEASPAGEGSTLISPFDSARA